MATVTLTLYKNTKLENNKNDIIEDIETYLGSLDSLVVDSDFQYQRFELDKTIKINMDQDYQTKANNINRYDYCKLTATVGDENPETVIYYYFITKTKQIAQKTIELTLRMDTLNTFHYSDTEDNNSYTLNGKTLVKREHKDRLLQEVVYSDSPLNKRRVGNVIVYPDDPITNKKYAPQIQWIMDNQTWETTTTFGLGLGTGHSESRYTLTIYNADGSIRSTNTGHNSIAITPYDDSVDFTVTFLDDTTEIFETFPNMYVVLTFTKLSSNSSAISHIIDLFNFTNMTGNAQLSYKRNIDTFQEGISAYLFKTEEETLYDDDGTNQWYVMYASTNAIPNTQSVTEVKYVNPVQIRFYSDNGYTISTSSPHEVAIYATSSLIPKWNNTAETLSYSWSTQPAAGTLYIKIAGVTYDLHDYNTFYATRRNNSDSFFDIVKFEGYGGTPDVTLNNIEYFIAYGMNQLSCTGYPGRVAILEIGAGSGSYTGTCDSWQKVDLTDPRLIKCFAFPYAPMDFLVGKSTFSTLPDDVVFNTDNVLELTKPQIPLFNYTKTFTDVNPQTKLLINLEDINIASNQPRNILVESKLLHSDYYQPKFVYDSFSFPFNLENIDIDGYVENSSDINDLDVNYVVSQNVQSKFLFSFPQYVLKRSTQDYDNVLTVERNNEKALFNNEYINYIRSGGYSYDQKKANSQNVMNSITTALSLAGGIAGLAASPFTGGSSAVLGASFMASGIGLTAHGLSSIARGINTAQEQDKAINQKVIQAQLQGTSVQGSEDIDMLTAVSGNKAKLVVYELSDIMKQAMWDLFHYCGYATHEQKVPETNTRLYFNFIQADIVYDEFNFNDDIAEDIKNRWAEGVTFFHKVNGEYDIEQQYENFETSLLQ